MLDFTGAEVTKVKNSEVRIQSVRVLDPFIQMRRSNASASPTGEDSKKAALSTSRTEFILLAVAGRLAHSGS